MPRLAIALLTAAVGWSCASRAPVTLERLATPPCETAGGSVHWAGPTGASQRAPLSGWCNSVGPPMVVAPAHRPEPIDIATCGLVAATWNVHVGGGDLVALVRALGQPSATCPAGPAVIVLVQEAVRSGDEVPVRLPSGVGAPGRIRPARAPLSDIVAVAAHLGMWMAYIPSMANGPATREDRGSAILSSLPLADITGIELPWGAQRRVAVMATAEAVNEGQPYRLRLASLHLNNRLSRRREAAAFAAWLDRHAGPDGAPLIIGADLNTWGGARERTVAELAAVAPRVTRCGDAPTFRWLLGFRLDYLFTTVPRPLLRNCEVGRDRLGSDHRPVILRLFGDDP